MKLHRSLSPCSKVSIRTYIAPVRLASNLASVDFPEAGRPENMYKVGVLISPLFLLFLYAISEHKPVFNSTDEQYGRVTYKLYQISPNAWS
ncbi:hypothetical protein VCR19J5_110004 [Vibrio crassostreae]|nr:hypothetical protein VCR19J5_110004 [Vibrio crassostreae]